MREILFRGKRLDNGEWVEGFIVANRENTYPDGFEMITVDGINYDELDNYAPDFISYSVVPSTVGQFTGLTDKNGKRIWEGDILKWDSMEWGCDHLEIASWDYELFDMRRNDWEEWCEVIGNIHDNPELLENP